MVSANLAAHAGAVTLTIVLPTLIQKGSSMFRMTLHSFVLTAIVSLLLVAVPARAQEASPPAGKEPIELLTPLNLPAAAALSTIRVTLEPDEMIPLHPHSALEMVFVVAGSVTLQPAEGPAVLAVRGAGEASTTPDAAGPGAELPLAAGDVVIVPPGSVYAALAGKEGVTVLIFGFAAPQGVGTPAA